MVPSGHSRATGGCHDRPVSAETDRDDTTPRTWAWHPILFGIGWVFANYVDTGVHLQTTFRVAAVVLVALALVLLGLRLASRSWHIAGIATTALLTILVAPDPVASLYLVVGFILATAVYLVARGTFARRTRISRLTTGLNAVAAIFLLLSLVRGVVNGTVVAGAGDVASAFGPPAIAGSTDGEGLPDIYLVVLDGYPRADTIRDRLGGDNDAFISELESRGFEVASASTSGYMYSDLAFTSLFHGRHLVEIPELEDSLAGATLPAADRQALNAAPLLELFRAHGYTTIANAQAWDEPALRTVDRHVDGSGLNEFERHMLRGTLIGATWEVIDEGLNGTLLVPWVIDGLDFIRSSPDIDVPGPRFVFTHIPSPHFPIVFEADGTRAPSTFVTAHPDQVKAPEADVVEAYLGQVAFLNAELLVALDSMDVPDDAIVIVMSDHGPEFGLRWYDEANTEFDVRFATLFASRNADGMFTDDVFLSEVLPRLARGVLGEPVTMPARRFFSNDAVDKFSTLTEVADPWH
jgi:hypothetical protein